MPKVFRTIVELNRYIESACEKAVKNACSRLLVKLQELIMSEFYDVYETDTYSRTYQFYESAMTEMLTKTCGQIFMNPDQMNYPFSGRGWAWDGIKQLEAASLGSHGGWTTEESKKHRFWNAFEEYCDENAIPILKQELKKQGLNVKG